MGLLQYGARAARSYTSSRLAPRLLTLQSPRRTVLRRWAAEPLAAARMGRRIYSTDRDSGAELKKASKADGPTAAAAEPTEPAEPASAENPVAGAASEVDSNDAESDIKDIRQKLSTKTWRTQKDGTKPAHPTSARHARSLSRVYKMAKLSFRREVNSMQSKLMYYKQIERYTKEAAVTLVEKHLERVQAALHLLKAVTNELQPEAPTKEVTPSEPPSNLEQLQNTIEEIKRRTSVVQRQSDVKLPEGELPREINRVLATTSILRGILNPPNARKVRQGVTKSIQETVAKEHRDLVESVAKAFPSLGITIEDDSSATSKPSQSPTGTEAKPAEDDERPSAVRNLPRILINFQQAPKADNTGAKEGKKAKKKEGEGKVLKVESSKLKLSPIETLRPPIPRLSYGLDRVLFNPGVYQLRDGRTGVYNFDPYLENIMPIEEFDFGCLRRYITSSKDTTLIDLAQAQGKRYTGSTSSMSGTLAHFHYLLSSWRQLNVAHTTRGFHPESLNFTRIIRAPSAVFLHHDNGTYAIDADKEFDTATVLSMLGQSMEKLFTLPKKEFELYRKNRSHQIMEEQKTERNAYNYTTMGDFLMRSQLDAQDDRLPGTGIFDLKTRAVVSIRMDASNIKKALGYEIARRFGNWESFEREYYDLVRSAFLKYSLQVRMGRMDGIFVAYHNTQTVFGFQYYPLADMDFAIHGTDNTELGDREFKLSVYLLNKVLDRATEKFPGKSLRLHFETRTSSVQPFMYIFAKPVTPGEIEEIQNANRDSVVEFERNILGLFREDEEASSAESETVVASEEEEESAEEAQEVESIEEEEDHAVEEESGEDEGELQPGSWGDLRSRVNEAIKKDEQGLDTIRDSIEDALEQSGLMPTDSEQADTKLYVDTLLEVLTQQSMSASLAQSQLLEHEQNSDDGAPFEGEQHSKVETSAEGTSSPASDTSIIFEDGANDPRTSAEEDKSEDWPSVAREAMASDMALATAPRAQPQVAALKALLLLHEQQQAEQLSRTGLAGAGGEEEEETSTSSSSSTTEPDHDETAAAYLAHEQETFSRIREFERILSTTLSDHPIPTSPSSEPTDPNPTDPGAPEHLHPTSPITPAESKTDDLVGFTLATRNFVDSKLVARPHGPPLHRGTKWEVEYSITEIPPATAQRLYPMLLQRRKKVLEAEDKDAEWYRMFQGNLHRYSEAGRKRRERRWKKEFGKDVVVFGEAGARRWMDAFEESHVEGMIRKMGGPPKGEKNDG